MVTEKDHEYCLRCGRKLKNPEARERGYGNICYKKVQFTGKKLFDGVAYLQSCNKKEPVQAGSFLIGSTC